GADSCNERVNRQSWHISAQTPKFRSEVNMPVRAPARLTGNRKHKSERANDDSQGIHQAFRRGGDRHRLYRLQYLRCTRVANAACQMLGGTATRLLDIK